MRRRWIPIAFALLAAVLTISFARRAGDFAGYVLVGELALAGRDVYRDAPPNISTWPPLFALLCVPIALAARVSLVGARAAWLVLNWAVLVAVLRMAVRLVYRRPLTLLPRPAAPADALDLSSAAVLVPLLLTARWISSNFEHLQVNIPVFALALLGLVLHARGKDAAAGAALGAAAALKVMPILFVPYFAWRRQWRAAGFTALAALAWSLVPAAVYGPSGFLDQVAAWRDAVRAGWSVGKMNLSVYAMLDRTVGHGLVPFTVPGVNDLAPSGAPAVTAALIAVLVIVTAAGMLLFRGDYRAGDRASIAEWSVVFLVASVFGTVAWKAYLVVLLLPYMLFVGTWRDPHIDPLFRKRLKALTWLSFAFGILAADDLVGRQFAWRMEMGSLLTVMSLLVLGILFWYRQRRGVSQVLGVHGVGDVGGATARGSES